MPQLWSGRKPVPLATVLFLIYFSPPLGWAQQPRLNRDGSISINSPATLEDWSSLSLVGSELRMAPPLLGERDDDNPGFVRDLIQVQWREDDPIYLYIIRPKGVAKPPVVLYLYSYPSEIDIFRESKYCESVTKGGFAAIGFVSALTGQRYNNRPMKQWFVSELQESLGSTVHDVQMILNYLSTRDDLDLTRVGMFGVGSGGTIAILSAAVEPRLKVIEVIDPWGDWPEWMATSSVVPEKERANYLEPEFLGKIAALDPVRWLPRLDGNRISIRQILSDVHIPRAAQDRIRDAAPPGARLLRFATLAQFTEAFSADNLTLWLRDRLRDGGPSLHNAQQTPANKETPQPVHEAVKGP